MEDTTEITVGQIVKSKAGRDRGRIFIVMDIIDDKFVMIADGDYRKLDNKKKKKIKHLVIYKKVIKEIKDRIEGSEKFNNAYVRKLLAPYKKEI
ncbi:MAG: hypothetical protein FH751_13065 [Firmicutes bacterium]|nr:hypothetical protein [Bacillota bacterium]